MHLVTLAVWAPTQVAGMVLASLLVIAVLMALFLIARAVLSPAFAPAPAGTALRQLYMRGEIPRSDYLNLIAGFHRTDTRRL